MGVTIHFRHWKIRPVQQSSTSSQKKSSGFGSSTSGSLPCRLRNVYICTANVSRTENRTFSAQFRTSSVRFFDIRNWDKANCIGSRFTVRLADSQNDTGVHIEEADKDRIKRSPFRARRFCYQLGSVSMSQTFKGVMVEVEYRPCVIPSNCWDLIREFMQGFMGSHVTNIIPPYFTAPSMMAPNQNKQNDIYQPIDTVQQYLEHFSNYRKLNNPPPAMGMRN